MWSYVVCFAVGFVIGHFWSRIWGSIKPQVLSYIPTWLGGTRGTTPPKV